jgi:hypothetical protein
VLIWLRKYEGPVLDASVAAGLNILELAHTAQGDRDARLSLVDR